jgi:LmbE family N-acetylglucosaminyl deacetylase
VIHVFVSPHPDDAALSCGGLIASLRERNEAVTIVSIFSGAGDLASLTPYQRLALGFGGQEKWQPGDTYLLPDAPDEGAAAMAAADAMAVRRAEDESFGRFAGATNVFLDLPDAVFRGYEDHAQLMGRPRPDDSPPLPELRRVLARLRPDRLYLPLAIGGHVDHVQARRAATTLLAEPDSPFSDRTLFYEDFPYAYNLGFERLDQLDPGFPALLPPLVSLAPEYIAIGNLIDRKLEGLRAYTSQLGRLFGGADEMVAAVRAQAARVGQLGGTGPAERYWSVTFTETDQG